MVLDDRQMPLAAAAGPPSARPSSRAHRFARGESRRGAAARRDAGSRTVDADHPPSHLRRSRVRPRRRFRSYSPRLTCGLSPASQRFLYQQAANLWIPRLRSVPGQGISLWNLWIAVLGLRRAREHPSHGTSHAVHVGAPPVERVDLPESGENRLLEKLRRPVVVRVRAVSGSGTTASTTPSSTQCAASGLNAAAAFRASPASRQRIAAQPSGEMTE